MSGERDAVGTSTDAYGNKQTDAFFIRNSSGNAIAVSGIRSTGVAIPSPYNARDVNIHAARMAEPLVTLDLPSPYYPSVTAKKEHAYGTPIFFPNGWSGWRFWMVGAPYPSTESLALNSAKYENPCIYVSNDGETWSTPTGLTNPIATSIGLSDSASYYADPYICTDSTQSKLYVIFCWFGRTGATKSSLMITESSDGITWSTPTEVFSSTSTTFTPNSPSLIQTSTGWTVVAIDTRDGTGTFTVMYSTTTASTPYTGWAAPGTVFSGVWTACTMTHPLSRNWWHMHVVGLQNDALVGMVADNSSSGGTAYTLKSVDKGKTWSVQQFSARNDSSAGGYWYRPSLCICNSGVNPDVLMYVSRIGPLDKSASGFWMQKARLAFDRSTEQGTREYLRGAVNAKTTSPTNVLTQSLLFWDSFQRGDSAVTLGTSDSGTAWTAQSGTLGISTNRGYGVSTGNNIATVNLGSSDYEFEFQIDTIGTQLNLVFGFVDTSNFYRWRTGNTNVERVIGGSVDKTFGQTTFTAVAANQIFRVLKQGNYVTFFFNDRVVDCISLLDTNDAALKVSGLVGWQCSGASLSYIKNFWARLPT